MSLAELGATPLPTEQLEDTEPLCRSLWKTGRLEFWLPTLTQGAGACVGPDLDARRPSTPSGKGRSEFVNPRGPLGEGEPCQHTGREQMLLLIRNSSQRPVSFN